MNPFRYAARSLARSRGFAVATMSTIALAVAAGCAVLIVGTRNGSVQFQPPILCNFTPPLTPLRFARGGTAAVHVAANAPTKRAIWLLAHRDHQE